MLSQLFLGVSLVGAEWVLYLLVLLSFLSIALIFERAFFYKKASRDLESFRNHIRLSASGGRLDEAARAAQERATKLRESPDLEAEMTAALLQANSKSAEILSEVANDSVARHRLAWEKNLSILATIGSNSPFIGLFGTVLGIIRAFHDLSKQAGAGASTVTAGISEALVATAVGLLVAIPAVIAYNLFQRRVKSALSEAESLKSFLIGKLAS
jgi:biopolymer transport protein ExbB